MSLRLAIPWRVALQQSPPPLRQPMVILRKRNLFEKRKSFNGRCSYGRLSQQRGPPQSAVVNFVAANFLTIQQTVRRQNFAEPQNQRLGADTTSSSCSGPELGTAVQVLHTSDRSSCADSGLASASGGSQKRASSRSPVAFTRVTPTFGDIQGRVNPGSSYIELCLSVW
jgi:hypothetical protein